MASVAGLLVLVGCTGSEQAQAKPEKAKPNLAVPTDRAAPVNPNDSFDDASKFIEVDDELTGALGVQTYPKAKIAKGTTGAEVVDGGLRLVLVTKDSPKEVAAFYLKSLAEAKQVGPKVDGMTVYALDGKNSRGQNMRVQAQGGPKLTSIHLILRNGS